MARVLPRLRTAKGAEKAKVGAEGKEAVIAAVAGIGVTPENPAVQLDANLALITPAESTEQVVRVRRGGLTGTEVAKITIKAGASAKTSVSIQVQDEPGEQADVEYSLTLEDVAKKLSEATFPTLQAIF